MVTLKSVHLDVTNRCNLLGKCKHCYGGKYFLSRLRDQLTQQRIRLLVAEMEKMGVEECWLSGGEPLLRRDLPEIISLFKDKAVRLKSVFTNGTVHRLDVVERLLKDSPATSFLVSLDGHSASAHEMMRGVGTFSSAMKFVRFARHSGVAVGVNTMVTKYNVDSLIPMLSMIKSIGASQWRLAIPRLQGEAGNNLDIYADFSDVCMAFEQIIKHMLCHQDDIHISVDSLITSRDIERKIIHTFSTENCCCEYKKTSITVKADGSVVPCPAFDNVIFGNVHSALLQDIWRSTPCRAHKCMPLLVTKCANCHMLKYCGGGCRRTAWSSNGDLYGKDKSACALQLFFQKLVLPLLHDKKFVEMPVEGGTLWTSDWDFGSAIRTPD
jgi:pyrroloquinoline quinone biosynthesis protein E